MKKYSVAFTMEKQKCEITDDDGDTMVCYGYSISYFKMFIFVLLVLCSGGFLILLCYWRRDWYLKLRYSRCSLREAQYVLLKTSHHTTDVEEVQTQSIDGQINKHLKLSLESKHECSINIHSERRNSEEKSLLNVTSPHCRSPVLRYFMYRHLKYVWNKSAGTFDLLRALDQKLSIKDIYDHASGLTTKEAVNRMLVTKNPTKLRPLRIMGNISYPTSKAHRYKLQLEDAHRRKNIYGKNMIDVEVKSYGRLFLEEGLDPFYVFQLSSVILWMFDDYYYYATAIIIISFGSILISVYQTKKHLRNLRNMVAKSDVVKVLRNNGVSEDVSSEDVVPGDVIVIPQNGAVMHCDAALISGNCIVNESMLTVKTDCSGVPPSAKPVLNFISMKLVDPRGESVPVTKIPLEQAVASKHSVPSEEKDDIYSPLKHKRQTLFNGTKVIQTRYYGKAKVLAVVICTGFYTTKGGLIRSILNPRPVGFKFFRDSMRFIGFMAFLAMFGFGYSVYTFVNHGVATTDIIKKALDVITIAVPPALPAAMSVGMVYALQRLKKQQIYCIAPSRINMCGKLKLFCFDKTGTLTEDGLDILGVVAVKKESMMISDATTLPKEPLLIAMATCHTLTVIDGELTGDPLDLKMFEATDWVLEEPGQDAEKFDTVIPVTVKPKNTEEFSMQSAIEGHPPFEVAILRQFPFSSDIQRMSVITRTLGASHMDVFVKGAPEMVASLCDPVTVPVNFQEELSEYTERGYRVIGLAHKKLGKKITWHQAQRIPRDQVEKDLTFIGLLIMQNALKPESLPIINTLQTANIRTVMVTGDNMLTAVSVARECEMVGFNQKVIRVNISPDEEKQLIWNVVGEIHKDSPLSHATQLDVNHRTRKPFHIATSGKTYAFIRDNRPDLLNKLLLYGTVFARMSPEQKTHLIEDLQSLDYCVGMCGDGANDCGALKAAHAGISLSEAEASIASPFTSKVPNIECVPKVIKEGRCALVTSFACFKYMALYSIVQFASVLILYTIGSNLGDWQFLYIDLIIITSLALVMGHQHPYPTLVARRPGGSLVAPIVLFSLILQIVVQITVQVVGNEFVKRQTWFEPVNMSVVIASEDGVQISCHQNTVLFTLTSFQYILLAVAFSRGKPYRLPIYRNIWFIVVLLVLSSFSLFLALYDSKQPFEFFELLVLPDFHFRLYLLGFVAVNFFLSLIIEDCIIPSKCVAVCINTLRRKKQPKNRYKRLEDEYNLDESWLPTPQHPQS